MNFEQTIQQLKERRDYYAAAIAMLEKIRAHEAAAAEMRPGNRKGGRGNGVPADEILRTLKWSASAAAKALGCTETTIYNRRAHLRKTSNGNGSVAVQ